MPIRALENHVFTATANRIGSESNGRQALTFIGQSSICGPSGETLASLGPEDEGIAAAVIDPTAARDRHVTVHNDLFVDRRTDAYVL